MRRDSHWVVKQRFLRWYSLSVVLFAGALLAGGAVEAKEAKKEQKRAEVREMAKETLVRLYSIQSSAENAVQNAAGYAVFSNFGMKIFVAGGGKGKGVAVNNATQEETFMQMAEVQAGLGFGVKKFSLVWVFETEEVLNSFINSGWEFGGQATAAAKVGDTGGALAGAVAVAPGVWLYQLTDDGLALELTAKGTKYYKDKELN